MAPKRSKCGNNLQRASPTASSLPLQFTVQLELPASQQHRWASLGRSETYTRLLGSLVGAFTPLSSIRVAGFSGSGTFWTTPDMQAKFHSAPGHSMETTLTINLPAMRGVRGQRDKQKEKDAPPEVQPPAPPPPRPKDAEKEQERARKEEDRLRKEREKEDKEQREREKLERERRVGLR